MPSSLTWLDHDPAARERSLRILSLFKERESRDELGLGAIRDSFADQLFPGTSTIQTRLRYMLFVPWIYHELERRQVPPGEFARQADQAERDLIDIMRGSDERQEGVFGGLVGRQLKRLPSSVYWAGLGAWGIRELDVAQDQYHRSIGQLYLRRAAARNSHAERERTGDDRELSAEASLRVWHPRLPEPPADFPGVADFELTVQEAGFLLDRIQRSQPRSLLAHLARHSAPAAVEFPWRHPDWAGFRPEHQELLTHGRLFSELIHGASLLYNLALSELRDWDEKVDAYTLRLQRWREELPFSEVYHWSLPRFWELTTQDGAAISAATRAFVNQWRELLLADQWSGPAARRLIQEREQRLKGGHSRFRNARARDQWGGASGTGRLTYRWSTAKQLLADLHAGLERREAAC